MFRRWTMVGDEVIHSRETAGASTVGARPLVLIHGVGTTSRYFRPLLHELDGRLPAVAVELPGIGASTSGELPHDLAGQADVVAAWLRATQRRPAALVGNSMGAQTVVEMALRHPELAERLILLGPTVDSSARGLLPQLGRLLVDATVERPSLLVLTVSDTFFTRRRAVLCYLRASLAHRIEERLRFVSAPVEVVRGELDPIVPRRWARELAATTPHAGSSEIAGAGHACHHGRPRAVADLLVEVVTDDPGALPSDRLRRGRGVGR